MPSNCIVINNDKKKKNTILWFYLYIQCLNWFLHFIKCLDINNQLDNVYLLYKEKKLILF